LISAAELDLFSKLKAGPWAVEDLCEAEGWNPRGVRILLDALAAQGLAVITEDGKYGVDTTIADWLAADGADSALPMILHRGKMWETWSDLTEIAKTGEKTHRVELMKTWPPEQKKAFARAMGVTGRITADKIAESLDLTRYKRMLDVGGAIGTYIEAFLRRAPHMTATLFELPGVVDVARETLTVSGLMDRVKIVEGDFNTDELPMGHDLAFLSAIIHMNDREKNRKLYSRIFKALEPGGIILIRDYVMDSTRTKPVEGAVFAVNMLVATSGGNSYTFDEIKEDLESAGFIETKIIREGEKMDQLVSAEKQ
jgi:predicted O-methyltransferase YrrM